MVDVEIDDRGALGAVLLLRVTGGDRRIVEQAEPHGPRDFRVVPRRARRHEGVGRALRHHLVDRAYRAASRAQRRLETAGRHRRVGIEMGKAVARRRLADALDVVDRVAERDGLDVGDRRLRAREHGEALVLEDALDGAQPVRPLRMPERRDVVEAGRMGEQKRGHVLSFDRLAQACAARLTPGGGFSSSGTKKSGASGSRGSTR